MYPPHPGTTLPGFPTHLLKDNHDRAKIVK